jgi:hypothetical protein
MQPPNSPSQLGFCGLKWHESSSMSHSIKNVWSVYVAASCCSFYFYALKAVLRERLYMHSLDFRRMEWIIKSLHEVKFEFWKIRLGNTNVLRHFHFMQSLTKSILITINTVLRSITRATRRTRVLVWVYGFVLAGTPTTYRARIISFDKMCIPVAVAWFLNARAEIRLQKMD